MVQVNKRWTKPYKVGNSLVVVIPKDWAAGMDVHPGDELVMFYDGEIRVCKPNAVP